MQRQSMMFVVLLAAWFGFLAIPAFAQFKAWIPQPGVTYVVHATVSDDGAYTMREALKLCPAPAKLTTHGAPVAYLAVAPTKPCPKP